MKQKIVINVAMHCEKCRRKALQIAAGEEGVSSVSIGGDGAQVVVMGDQVDSVCLAKLLRKKFRHAIIHSVEEVKQKKEEKKEEIKPIYYYPPPYPPCYSYVVCDPYPKNNCTIM